MNSIDQYNGMNSQPNNIPDFGMPKSNMNPNNGGLFNQPLNIVETDRQYEQEEKTNEMNNNMSMNSNSQSNELNNPFMNSNQQIISSNQNSNIEAPNTEAPLPTEPVQTVPDIEVIGDFDVPNKDEAPKEEPKNDYIRLEQEITIHNVHDAVMELKKTTDKIKQNHINIETEEIDFDDVYQITIKIKKEDF